MTQPLSLPATAGPPQVHPAGSGTHPCVNSNEILRGQKTVGISHNGSTYKLQATRLGKLILTK